MKDFFKLESPEAVIARASQFPCVGVETLALSDALGRVLAQDIEAAEPVPTFARSTMDGYAVQAASTFGASDGSPAFINLVGSVIMGQVPDFSVGPGEAARIATGAMLPQGCDAVVMIEHSDTLDANTIEVYRSVAPGQNVIQTGEDVDQGESVLRAGSRLQPQQLGLLAALGESQLTVYQKPRVGILSTGDEVVPIEASLTAGQVRDVNSHTLAALVSQSGAHPVAFGLVQDDYQALKAQCERALAQTDMLLISGGSSVGTRDLTVDVLSQLPQAEILVHGISIKPGKPAILARVGKKPFWGLPGHVASAMVVFHAVVAPYIRHMGGADPGTGQIWPLPARLSRNLSSAQGRVEYVRVRIVRREDTLWAEPILGKSGLIRPMAEADGFVVIGMNDEGLDAGSRVDVIPF